VKVDNTGILIDDFYDSADQNRIIKNWKAGIMEDNNFLTIEKNIKDKDWCFQKNININDEDIETFIYNNDDVMFIPFAIILSLKKEKIIEKNNNRRE